MTWCFNHSCAEPCDQCDIITKAHPFMGRCFDCKREFGSDCEDTETCGCGSIVRKTGFYRYPEGPPDQLKGG